MFGAFSQSRGAPLQVLLKQQSRRRPLLSSKAQWDKTRPKSRCQCDACSEREGQGQNCSYVHGNHPSSAMFGAGDDLVGLSIDQE
jgi:hypothetical protein